MRAGFQLPFADGGRPSQNSLLPEAIETMSAPRNDTQQSGCQICSSPTGDGANLCRTHTAALTHLLRQIPDQVEIVDRGFLDAYDRPVVREIRDRSGYPIPYQLGDDPILAEKVNPGLASELETTITRQDKLAVTSGPATSGEKPLNWNNRASEIAWDLKSTINAWALEASKRDEDPRDPLAALGIEMAPVAEWLIRNINTLRLLPDVGEAYSELTDAIKRAESAIDRSAFSSRFVVGPCPEKDDEDVQCPGEVWAFVPIDLEKPAIMTCQNEACGATWNTTQWRRIGERILKRKAELERQEQRGLDAA